MRNRYQIQNRFVSERDALATRARVARRHGSFNFLDETHDLEWAKQHSDSSAPNLYFDYFFNGTDVRIHVAELADDEEFGSIPIHQFGFNVEQEKSPVYGYWSYTYDAMMRGVRLITGQFVVVTKYPDYMKKLLSKAASNRASRHNRLSDDYPAPASWRKDDENIDRYWGKHIDASATAQHGTEWSIHPPFSFVIVYGVQNTSIETRSTTANYSAYGNDNALLADHNQRLVEGYNPNQTSRIVLDGCELTSVSRAFSTDMPYLTEVYTFFARDVIVPPARYRSNAGRAPSSGGGTHFVQ